LENGGLMIKLTMKEHKAIQRALKSPDTYRAPIHDFLSKSGLTVEGRAKKRAPVDTGRYRASIKTEVEPLVAYVGSNLKYAPFIEYGTRPHWPPLSAMQPWARRHGFPSGRGGAFLVARRIAQRGTKALMVLHSAKDDSMNDIQRFLKQAAKAIERRITSG
jgi:phage gpG-like protein